MQRWLLTCVGLLLPAPLLAADPTYWQDIRPLLRKHCTVCHNARKLGETEVSAGLALDTLDAIRKGGKVPVLVPGKSAESLLVTLLREKDENRLMPLGSEPLDDAAVDLFRRWVDGGAKEGTRPADADAVVTATRRPAKLRKLPVLLPTSVTTPGLAGVKPGPLAAVLPIGPLSPVTAVTFSPDGKMLAVGSYGLVTLWDMETVQPQRALTQVLGAVNDVRFSPDGQLLAVAGGQPSARGDLRLFRVRDGALLGMCNGHTDVVASIAFRPDGQQLASASFDKSVRIWDVAKRQAVQTVTAHSDFVYAVAWGPKGDWIATASKDRTVRISDSRTGQSKVTCSGMEQEVLAVAVAPNGEEIVSAGAEPPIRWWKVEDGASIRRQAGHGAAVNELHFGPEATGLLASAGSDRTVRLWNAKTGAAMASLSVPAIPYAVALRPDGKRLVAGGADGLVRIWEVGSNRLLMTLLSVKVDRSIPDWLAFTPEGYLAGSNDLLPQVHWQAGTQALPRDRLVPIIHRAEMLVKAMRAEPLPPLKLDGKP